MVRSVLSVMLLCMFIPSAGQASPQGPAENASSDPDARSFMELFTDLERRLDKAVQEKDEPALKALLAPEFLVRSSTDPRNPVSRTSWIASAVARNDARPARHDAMAIRAFLGVAVVSFVRTEKVGSVRESRAADYLIVDIWETNHQHWQLSQRYLSPVSSSPRSAQALSQ